MATESLVFNGINAVTGEYLLEVTPEQISKIIRGEKFDKHDLAQLTWAHERATQEHLGPMAGRDSLNLAETGWGVIFAYDADPVIIEALKELLDYRKALATQENEAYYKECTGYKGYRPGESAWDFLARHQASLVDPADPNNMPYYLLIVGDPETIPYHVQYQLDVQYAVGRIHFDTPEEYAQYARSVVEAEQRKDFLPRQATFFGVRNPDDRATALTTKELVKPLAQEFQPDQLPRVLKEQPNLSHPKGGALAVIGHVDRAWTYSFLWSDAGRQTASFQSTLIDLLQNYPVGAAMEYFNERHKEQ